MPPMAQRDRTQERYARQLLVPEWGEAGQARLRAADVLVVGAGGSGSPLLYYLAAAGVGRIRICDGDTVEVSNLNRQILHDESRLGMNKARSAAQTLALLNADIDIVAYEEPLSPERFDDMAGGTDAICCAVDDLEATRVLGGHAARSGIPLVWGGSYYLGGFVTVVHPPETPCVECSLAGWERARARGAGAGSRLLPTAEKPGPIVGAAAGAAGSIQAMEALKVLVGDDNVRRGTMLAFQLGGADMGFRTLDMESLRRPGCATCGRNDAA